LRTRALFRGDTHFARETDFEKVYKVIHGSASRLAERMASTTCSARLHSATSCTRTTLAPCIAATTQAAMVPSNRRSLASALATFARNDLREGPTRTG